MAKVLYVGLFTCDRTEVEDVSLRDPLQLSPFGNKERVFMSRPQACKFKLVTSRGRVSAIMGWCHGISSKMDFTGEEDHESTSVTNSTNGDDEDVEVKHTIVVSTKLKNNNRRGLHTDDNSGSRTYNPSGKETKEDSGEVPIVNGYKSVETTLIRTPDTRYKNRPGSQMLPNSASINRNAYDQFDIYPNYINNPTQWKPSTLYNNINFDNQEVPMITYNGGFTTLNRRPVYQTPGKFHRRITDDGMKEFYCSKCRELQGITNCGQSRSNPWSYMQNVYETTTSKIKLDGKLVKLN